MEKGKTASLPQYYADRFGWEGMVAAVADAYHGLPPEERAGAGILAANYGEAGAVDFFGARHGLPRAASGHNNYFLWGPGETTGDVLVVVGWPRRSLERVFEEVTQAGIHRCEYCMAYENDLPVWVTRRPRVPLSELWPRVKHFE